MDFCCGWAKLLVVTVDDHQGSLVIEAMREAGIPGCTKTWGRGLVESDPAARPSWIPQDILFTLLNSGIEPVLNAVSRIGLATPGLRVMGMLLDASGINTASGSGSDAQRETTVDGSEDMNPEPKLIVAIVSRGYIDEIMQAARQAGARGGTIIDAHGTGTEEDAKFFGISLAPEKEMLMILASADQVPPIIAAMRSHPILGEPGGGIIFTVNVEQAFFAGSRPDADGL